MYFFDSVRLYRVWSLNRNMTIRLTHVTKRPLKDVISRLRAASLSGSRAGAAKPRGDCVQTVGKDTLCWKIWVLWF